MPSNIEFFHFVLMDINQFLVYGHPQLSSSIGSLELSGENWFVDDERLAEYDYENDESSNFNTTTNSNLLNATVQLRNAIRNGSTFSFIDFTLSSSISSLVHLQGRNITCGVFATRSFPFEIIFFTTYNHTRGM